MKAELALSRIEISMSTAEQILDEFCTICEQVWMDHELYVSLCEADQDTMDLCNSIAPMFFADLTRILIEHQFLQFSKVTDPARTGKKFNLTTNYILKELTWPHEIRRELQTMNERLMAFRTHIEIARSKRIAHVDVSTQLERIEPLGEFPAGADKLFLQDLQNFINIAYGYLHEGAPRPIDVAMSTDTYRLIKALEKSVVFDQCPNCSENERIAGILKSRDKSV
jgi:hypothetical protein